MKKRIVVCVTIQLTCRRLIEYASNIAQKVQGELFVVNVSPKGGDLMGNSNAGAATDYLFEATRQYGGEMTILRSNDVFATLSEYIKSNNINTVVLGASGKPEGDNGLIRRLTQSFPSVEFLVPAE